MNLIKLKKGMIVANATKLDIINVESIKCGSAVVDDVSVPELFSNRSDLTTKEKESCLVTMISKYQTELNECGDQPKVPYEHEIKVVDDRPYVHPTRRFPYSQWEEIDNQIDTLLEKKYISELKN